MTKPVIIALCGKSAAGKDTIAKQLYHWCQSTHKNCYLMVSDTSRPARNYETDGEDYNFLSHLDFLTKIDKHQYLEYAEFKGWYYGTPKTEIKADYNIGVFNLDGINQLLEYSNEYIIIPICIEAPLLTRLHRSYQREKCWKWEYIRRAWRDYQDFKNIDDSFLRITNIDSFRTSSLIIKYLKRTLGIFV